MRDRLSTKILSNGATRYGVYDETGNLLRYEYIKLEDEPTVDGDLFSKANMLPDSIPAALGLKMGNPQVKDALNVLANIGNVHVWQRVQTYADPVPEVPAGYTLGAVEENVLIAKVKNSMVNASNGKMVVVYSENVDVSNDGDVSMPSDASSIEGFLTAVPNNFSSPGDKYVRYENSTYGSIIFNVSDIVYLPADSVYSVTEDDLYNYLYVSKLQRVTGYPYTPAIPAGTHVDYLTSTDPNAYPKQSAEGGQDASYVLGDVVSGTIVPVTTGQVQFKYSTTVTVYDNGDLNVDGDVVNLQNYNTEGTSTIKGKYIVPVTTGASISGVWFISSDATFSLISVDGDATKRYLYCDKMQPVTGYPAIPANTVITYLGQIGGGARIDVGSYVGTGTYGSSNPNTLTFEFEPKIIWIAPISYTDISATIRRDTDKGIAIYVATNIYTLTTSWSGNAVTWYSNQALYQLNASGVAYSYIALG